MLKNIREKLYHLILSPWEISAKNPTRRQDSSAPWKWPAKPAENLARNYREKSAKLARKKRLLNIIIM